MATRGLTARAKQAIKRKIRDMDTLIDRARRAYRQGNNKKAIEYLDQLEEMKESGLITLMPHIALQSPRHDIPFSVLYEIYAEVLDVFWGFFKWARAEAGKPPNKRRRGGRRAWITRLRRVLQDLNHIYAKKWRANDPAKPAVKRLITEVTRLITMFESFGANDKWKVPGSHEIEKFIVLYFKFLEKASDDDFNLKEMLSKLWNIDMKIDSERVWIMSGDNSENMRERILGYFETLEHWKHQVGDWVEAAETVKPPEEDE